MARSFATLERFFERLLERPAARLFRARLQPVQLQRRLERAMEARRVVSADRTYVPNRYRVLLHPSDLETFDGYRQTLETDLAEALLRRARSRGYRLVARPEVYLLPSESVSEGDIEVNADVLDPSLVRSAAAGLRPVGLEGPRPPRPPIPGTAPVMTGRGAPEVSSLAAGSPQPTLVPSAVGAAAPVVNAGTPSDHDAGTAPPAPAIPGSALQSERPAKVDAANSMGAAASGGAAASLGAAARSGPAASVGAATNLGPFGDVRGPGIPVAAPSLPGPTDSPIPLPVRPPAAAAPSTPPPVGPALPDPLARPVSPEPLARPAPVTVPALAPRAVVAMAVIAVQPGGAAGWDVPFQGATVSVGRGTDNHIVLLDERVSRHHGRFTARQGTLVYTDLGSTNGSFVGRAPVREIALGVGDVVRVGGSTLTIRPPT